MKYFVLLTLFLFACKPSGYEPNTVSEIKLIELNSDEDPNSVDQKKLADLIAVLSEANVRAIVVKPILQTADTSLTAAIAASAAPVYGSAAVDDERGKTVAAERVFEKSNLLLKRSFQKAIVPADTLNALYKAVGIEAATFRNSGQLESYYVAIALHGVTTASLPYALVCDLIGKGVNEINPVNLFLSKNGTMPVRFSEPDTYAMYHIDDVLTNTQAQNALAESVVIVYQGTERIPTLQGAKLKAEITADVINQLANQLTVE